jgi:DNA-binding response OmpR family regulator
MKHSQDILFLGMNNIVLADRFFSPVRKYNISLGDINMIDQNTIEATVLFHGLDSELAMDLRDALAGFCEGIEAEVLTSSAHARAALRSDRATVVFCGTKPEVVKDLRRINPHASIIAVSRLPETTDWLNVIEAGADDYCAAPFESHQLRWILDSTLSYSRAAA